MIKNINPLEKPINMHKQPQPFVKWFNRRRVLLFVLFFSVAFLGAAIFLLTSKNNLLKNEYEKQKTYIQQKEAFEKLGLYIKTAETANRGYALSGDKKFIESFDPDILKKGSKFIEPLMISLQKSLISLAVPSVFLYYPVYFTDNMHGNNVTTSCGFYKHQCATMNKRIACS